MWDLSPLTQCSTRWPSTSAPTPVAGLGLTCVLLTAARVLFAAPQGDSLFRPAGRPAIGIVDERGVSTVQARLRTHIPLRMELLE